MPPVPARPSQPATLTPGPTAPLKTAGLAIQPKKRAATRNQYTKLLPYPSPLSPYTHTAALGARRRAPPLQVTTEEVDGGGRVTTYTVLLSRDAGVYHAIAARLSMGDWGRMDGVKRKKVEEECGWLGMEQLRGEVVGLKQKSSVIRGGEGYV